jgi:glycerol-3-phosphate acyltransferase PlsX
MIRIAVDAMGGDFAPQEVVAGAVQAAREQAFQLILVGQPEAIQSELAGHDTTGLDIVLEPASDVIHMDEQPAITLRQKPDASILISTELVRDGKADASVTMGHTGAGMIAAVWALGRIEGILRPAAGITYFGLRPDTFVLDLGLNVDCKPQYLLQFGVMGSIYMQQIHGIPNPTVALLSNGAEDNKGHEIGREAFPLLKKSGLNFIGNVEGMDVAFGKANVIVCDGFGGNVVLKLTEGLTESLLDALEGEMKGALPSDIFTDKFLPALSRVRQMMDYSEIGAAPVLGVKGVSVIGHGRSRAKAVVSGIRQARLAVERDLVGAIERGWEAVARREDL